MRKLLGLLLVFTFVALAGCGKSTPKQSGPAQSKTVILAVTGMT